MLDRGEYKIDYAGGWQLPNEVRWMEIPPKPVNAYNERLTPCKLMT